MLLSISKAAVIRGVCTKTLRRLHAANIFLPDVRTLGGHRRYSIERLRSFIRKTADKKYKKKLDNSESQVIMNGFQNAAIYARVSAAKQREDLDRQITFLDGMARNDGFNDVIVYKDIASGLNDKRQGLKRLIKDAFAGRYTALFITHRDRLARFGTSIIGQIMESLKIDIKDLETSEALEGHAANPMNTLVNDVLAILTSYSGKLYRMRRGSFS